jgi:hypothetical protein
MKAGLTSSPCSCDLEVLVHTNLTHRFQTILLSMLGCLLVLVNGSTNASDGTETLRALQKWVGDQPLNDDRLKAIQQEAFSKVSLSRVEAEAALQAIWAARAEFLRGERKAEVDAREIQLGDLKMPFWYKTFGEAPEGGRSLFISMHGGGGAPAAVNDQQYENQKRLYQPEEGIYLVPRAPTNTWNLWHEGHIDQFFDRLIVDMMLFENVNPNRIYFMGYSAGGDGVYQLAPRMADRLAAASMMAGHPNESRPDGLRNIGFTLHMGANDGAYNRNKVAAEWGEKLAVLQKNDPDGYVHSVTLHEGRGHWMNLQDAVAVPWMAKFTRAPWPSKIVWVQDDICHRRFYWLQVNPESAKAGDEMVAIAKGSAIKIEKSSTQNFRLLLNDKLVDLDKALTVTLPDGTTSSFSAARTIESLCQSLLDRDDPECAYSASIEVGAKPSP